MVHILGKKKLLNSTVRLVGICFLGILPMLANAQDNKVDETDKPAINDDLIRLESTFVGDKEQPSVSYFIRWKGTDSPDGLRWNIQRKNDDTLGLIDRDIMLRSMNIYNEMQLEE